MNCWGRFWIARRNGNSIGRQIFNVRGYATQSLIDCSLKHSTMSCIGNRRQKICIKFSSKTPLLRTYEPSLKIIFISNNHRHSFYNFNYYSILIIFQRTQLWPSHYLSLPFRTFFSIHRDLNAFFFFLISLLQSCDIENQLHKRDFRCGKARRKEQNVDTQHICFM